MPALPGVSASARARFLITLIVTGAATPACMTHIVPVKPIETVEDGHQAKVARLISWGSPSAMEIDIDTPDEVGLMAVRAGTPSEDCGAGQDLVVLRAIPPGTEDFIDRTFDILAPIPEVDPTVPLPNFIAPGRTRLRLMWPAISRMAGTVDVALRSLASQTPPLRDRCLRLELPQTKPTWRVDGSRSTVLLGLGFSLPVTSHEAGASGIDLVMEAGRTYGATRLVFRGILGLAICGTDCSSQNGDTSKTLVFQASVGVGVERKLALGERWSLGMGGGYSLGASDGLNASFESFRHGPYATLRILRTNPPPPMLLDSNAPGGMGVELRLQRDTDDKAGSGFRAGLAWVYAFQ